MSRTRDFGLPVHHNVRTSNSTSEVVNLLRLQQASPSTPYTNHAYAFTHVYPECDDKEGHSMKDSYGNSNQTFSSKQTARKSTSFLHRQEINAWPSSSHSTSLVKCEEVPAISPKPTVEGKIIIGKKKMQLKLVKLPLGNYTQSNGKRDTFLSSQVLKSRKRKRSSSKMENTNPNKKCPGPSSVKLQSKAENVNETKPEHVNETKPEHMNKTKPEHVNETEPEHVNETKPEHVNETKPEHVNETEPEHVNETKPGHVNETKPKHVNETKPEHVEETKPEHVDKNSCSSDDEPCYRVVPIANVASTCARTSTYQRKKQLSWLKTLVDHVRMKPVSSARKQPTGKSSPKPVKQKALEKVIPTQTSLGKKSSSGSKMKKKNSRFKSIHSHTYSSSPIILPGHTRVRATHSCVSNGIPPSKSALSIKQARKQTLKKKTALTSFAQYLLQKAPPSSVHRVSKEKKREKMKSVVNKCGSRRRDKRCDSSVRLSKPPSKMRRHFEDREPLIVSIDRSLLTSSTPPAVCTLLTSSTPPAVCTLATQHVGTYRSVGVQATSGMVVDEEALEVHVQTLVDDDLRKIKRRLNSTVKKVNRLVRQKESLERMLQEKINYSIVEPRTSLPLIDVSTVEQASAHMSTASKSTPQYDGTCSRTRQYDRRIEPTSAHNVMSKSTPQYVGSCSRTRQYDRRVKVADDFNSKQSGLNCASQHLEKERATDPNSHKWSLLGNVLQCFFLTILNLYIAILQLPLRKGLEKLTISLRVNLKALLSCIPFPQEIDFTVHASNVTVDDKDYSVPLSDTTFQLGWLAVQLRSFLRHCENFRHVLPLTIQSYIFVTDHSAQKILEELVTEIRRSAAIPPTQPIDASSNVSIVSEIPLPAGVSSTRGILEKGSELPLWTATPSNDPSIELSTVTSTPVSASTSNGTVSLSEIEVYQALSLMYGGEKAVVHKALECVTKVLNSVMFNPAHHATVERCQVPIPVSTPTVTAAPRVIHPSPTSLPVNSSDMVSPPQASIVTATVLVGAAENKIPIAVKRKQTSQTSDYTSQPRQQTSINSVPAVRGKQTSPHAIISGPIAKGKQTSPHAIISGPIAKGKQTSPHTMISGPEGVGRPQTSTNSIKSGPTVVDQPQTSVNSGLPVVGRSQTSNSSPAVSSRQNTSPNSVNSGPAVIDRPQTSPNSVNCGLAVVGRSQTSNSSPTVSSRQNTSPNSVNSGPAVIDRPRTSPISVNGCLIPASVSSFLSLDVVTAQALSNSSSTVLSPSLKSGYIATLFQSSKVRPLTTTGINQVQSSNYTNVSSPNTSLLAVSNSGSRSLLKPFGKASTSQSITKKLQALKKLNGDAESHVVGSMHTQGFSQSYSKKIQTIKDKDKSLVSAPVGVSTPSRTVSKIL